MYFDITMYNCRITVQSICIIMISFFTAIRIRGSNNITNLLRYMEIVFNHLFINCFAFSFVEVEATTVRGRLLGMFKFELD
jgi:hypothetical protein